MWPSYNINPWQRPIGLVLLVALATACSQRPAAPDQPRQASLATPGSQRTFSAEEKRAARSLSIGNDASEASPKSPYEASATCLVAIDYLVEKLRDAGALSEDRQTAMNQAKSIYERRALAQEERDRAGLTRDLAKIRQSFADRQQELGRPGLGCLQRLL